jgi:hypothetical protein
MNDPIHNQIQKMIMHIKINILKKTVSLSID